MPDAIVTINTASTDAARRGGIILFTNPLIIILNGEQ
ncbi:MAG: hypothetical protein SBU_000521 [Candidatus Syntrophoarchaeum butanivorans]|uniref:Uncharacterized protein n=1 Tax=Candidatus Syntropharchaeum butanivorans TaxID=1839936 RepID=A0A1F2P5V9_9EURY|nr:MAG: hypothetical protein SBU_000521 [Candidatus Syntrophoarchaeum butanivorans]